MIRVKNPTGHHVRLELFGLGVLSIPPGGVSEISGAMWDAIQNPALWGDNPCPLVIYTEPPQTSDDEQFDEGKRKPGRYRIKEE